MKIKTATLTRSALDWAVAIAKGIPAEDIRIDGHGNYMSLFRYQRDEDGNLDGTYRTGPDLLFSSKWEAGGPIIEREKITVSDALDSWAAGYNGTLTHFGPTPLIAAMRAYVASKLGDEIDVPEELA